jgi:hypothetical protein
MPAHVAAVLSIALLSVRARASDGAFEQPWDDGAPAALEEAEDRGAPEAELALDALLLGEDPALALDEDLDAVE